MASLRLASVALCLIAIAFAGCAGGSKTVDPTSSTAAPPTVDEDSGSISGFVIDDQVLPVAGADVGIVDLGLTTTSDEQGAFTLNDVPPGDHTLFASKLGYAQDGKRVTVVVGEILEMRLTLVPLAVEEPRHESIPFSGQFQCSLAAVDQLWLDCGVESDYAYNFEKPTGVRHLVGELRWTSASAGTGQNLDFNLVAGKDRPESQWYANVFGPSPLRMVVTIGEEFTNPDSPAPVGSGDKVVDDEDHELGFNIYASPTYVQDTALIGLTLEQKFNGYVTLFYGKDVPEGFSAFPDA